MKIEPNGKSPPKKVITNGSVYHFFSGIGLGTALTRQGLLDDPLIALPNNVPIRLHGKMTNIVIATIANYLKGV